MDSSRSFPLKNKPDEAPGPVGDRRRPYLPFRRFSLPTVPSQAGLAYARISYSNVTSPVYASTQYHTSYDDQCFAPYAFLPDSTQEPGVSLGGNFNSPAIAQPPLPTADLDASEHASSLGFSYQLNSSHPFFTGSAGPLGRLPSVTFVGSSPGKLKAGQNGPESSQSKAPGLLPPSLLQQSSLNTALTSSSSTIHLRRALEALPYDPAFDEPSLRKLTKKNERERRRKLEHYIPAVWVPDAKAKSCMRCDSVFNWRRRRHHCRLCGRCVCASCSGKTFFIKDLSGRKEATTPARACNECYDSVFPVMEPTENFPLHIPHYSNIGTLTALPASKSMPSLLLVDQAAADLKAQSLQYLYPVRLVTTRQELMKVNRSQYYVNEGIKSSTKGGIMALYSDKGIPQKVYDFLNYTYVQVNDLLMLAQRISFFQQQCLHLVFQAFHLVLCLNASVINDDPSLEQLDAGMELDDDLSEVEQTFEELLKLTYANIGDQNLEFHFTRLLELYDCLFSKQRSYFTAIRRPEKDRTWQRMIKYDARSISRQLSNRLNVPKDSIYGNRRSSISEGHISSVGTSTSRTSSPELDKSPTHTESHQRGRKDSISKQVVSDEKEAVDESWDSTIGGILELVPREIFDTQQEQRSRSDKLATDPNSSGDLVPEIKEDQATPDEVPGQADLISNRYDHIESLSYPRSQVRSGASSSMDSLHSGTSHASSAHHPLGSRHPRPAAWKYEELGVLEEESD